MTVAARQIRTAIRFVLHVSVRVWCERFGARLCMHTYRIPFPLNYYFGFFFGVQKKCKSSGAVYHIFVPMIYSTAIYLPPCSPCSLPGKRRHISDILQSYANDRK